MICRESLNPKVQGSIPCASTNMLCLRVPYDLHVVVDLLRCVTFAAFDSFAGTPNVADGPNTAEIDG
jgi:hypothetical protein